MKKFFEEKREKGSSENLIFKSASMEKVESFINNPGLNYREKFW